jgi:transcriptional regulator with XRE-family HTH domain
LRPFASAGRLSVTLDEYRTTEGLSYAALASRLAISSASLARKYALGIRRPEADEIDRICAATGGAVTPLDFHQARAAHLAARGPASTEAAC